MLTSDVEDFSGGSSLTISTSSEMRRIRNERFFCKDDVRQVVVALLQALPDLMISELKITLFFYDTEIFYSEG